MLKENNSSSKHHINEWAENTWVPEVCSILFTSSIEAFFFEAVDSIVFSCIDLAVTLFTSDTPKVFSGLKNNELIFIFLGELSF